MTASSTANELLAKLRDDVAVLRRHSVTLGAKMDELDGRLSTEVAALRRDLPGMMADAVREVLKEPKG